MKTDQILKELLDWQGQTYAAELGIDLSGGKEPEVFKWFLAAILFGARISETIVKNTYREFKQSGLITPQKILKAGWDRLVEVLDAGGYVRYDFKTADKLLEVMGNLLQVYSGSLNILHEEARDTADLIVRLQALGRGIGPTTCQIFLRELRGTWEKANPPLSDFAIQCARHLHLLNGEKEPLLRLQTVWSRHGKAMGEFPLFEAALLRVGKNYCRKNRCEECRLKKVCVKEV